AVGTRVLVTVGVLVGVPVTLQSCWTKVSSSPGDKVGSWHPQVTYIVPRPFCAPTTIVVSPLSRSPYTMSNLSCPSKRRISKFVYAPRMRTVRHSILKTRLGAVPVVEVKMPHPSQP